MVSQDFRSRVAHLVPAAVRGSFVRKFVAAVLVAVLVAGGIGAVFYTETTQTLDQRVETQVVSTAELQADGLDNWVDGFQRQTRTLSSVKEFQNGQPGVIKDYLLLESDDLTSEFVAVHYVQASDGTVEASTASGVSGETLASLGVPWGADMAAIDDETDTPGSVVVPEEPYRSPVTNDSVLAFVSSAPQNTEHVVVVEANLSARTESFRGSLADSETTIVGPAGAAVVGNSVPGETAATVTDDGTNGFTQSSETVYGYASLDSIRWTVVTQVPVSSAYALRNQIATSLLLTLVSAVVVLGGVTIAMSRRSATVLSELAETADEMRAGDLDVTLDTSRSDEIGRLFDAFDEMRESLREQIADAEAARENAESAKSEAESAKREAEAAREAAEELSDSLQNRAEDYAEVMAACADGDLTARMSSDADAESMARIATAYNDLLDEWEDTIREVRSFSEAVDTASETVSENVDAVQDRSASVKSSAAEMADGAATQSEKLETVWTELEDLSATVEEVSTAADTVRNRADEALSRSQSGRTAAERAATALDDIERSTGETVAQVEELDALMGGIESVTDLITNIADQTTMLALNANIEAARAGNGGDGDGFAVVADEVKTLADETVAATADIEAAIGEMRQQVERTVDEMHATQSKVDTGTETVSDALDAFDNIVGDIEDATSGMREIDRATDEQAESTQEVVSMVETVGDISDDTAVEAAAVADAATEQVGVVDDVESSVAQLSDRATDLGQLLETFTLDEPGSIDSGTDVFETAPENHMGTESTGDD
ncbi:methyl-accepting chemotaxis protein [Haloarcula sp. CBA1127]|uniref:methyl-accepting chemotaxis protein n=1 Tax=Haloarcula sp. CBA1127 TaxID=1765055 RepID=UPI00073E186C|nr:methyl-accepting chemotaxis protein [Haloarcula sp. CBA1127]